MRLLIAILVSSCALFAQANPEIPDVYNSLSRHAARIEPMLRQLKPAEWVAKGASDTYVAQLNSALNEIEGIQNEMSALAQHPERMTDGMKALFHVETSHQLMGSLMGGLRRYQNPALADLIEAVAAEDRSDIEKLQVYLVDLASAKEQQFDLVDKEAQRCRGLLSRQPSDTRPVRKNP